MLCSIRNQVPEAHGHLVQNQTSPATPSAASPAACCSDTKCSRRARASRLEALVEQPRPSPELRQEHLLLDRVPRVRRRRPAARGRGPGPQILVRPPPRLGGPVRPRLLGREAGLEEGLLVHHDRLDLPGRRAGPRAGPLSGGEPARGPGIVAGPRHAHGPTRARVRCAAFEQSRRSARDESGPGSSGAGLRSQALQAGGREARPSRGPAAAPPAAPAPPGPSRCRAPSPR